MSSQNPDNENEIDAPTMAWFGDSWDSAICRSRLERVATPIGTSCIVCSQPIGPADQGILLPYDVGTVVSVHRACAHQLESL